MLGFPGAATLGPAIETRLLTDAAVAPGGAWALVFGADGETAAVVRDLLKTPVDTDLGEVPTGARVLFSESGDSALLVSAGGSNIQWITGLPNTPAVGPVIELGAQTGGLLPIAIGNGGKHLILSEVANERQTLYWTPANRIELHPLGQFVHVSAICLSEDDRDAAVADDGANEFVVLRDVYGFASRITLAQAGDGVDRPAGAGFAGNRVFVTNGDSASVLVFDRHTLNVTHTLQVPAAPVRCERIGKDLFLLTNTGLPSVYVLDLSAEPRIVFIPLGELYAAK
ncbi:MAG: hypothetical protein ABSC05_14840 [Candidatus Solibacter sp.]